MRLWARIAPILVPLLIVIAVTEVLYFCKDVVHAHHLVFFYLLPTAFVAMLYGSVLSMICAIDATFLAAFFLCDPSYSVYVSDPREMGELMFFAVTALIGAKCTAELTRPQRQHHIKTWADLNI
jgi:K+-sensing histidine kinase KdpD